MPVLLISYDLNGHERPKAYERVRQYVETHAISSIKPLYSQWLVETNSTPEAWQNGLVEGNLIDRNDYLLIVAVARPYQGWLNKADWDWLSARV